MGSANRFDEEFRLINLSTHPHRDTQNKFIQSAIQYDIASRNLNQKKKDLTDIEAEISSLKSKNRQLRIMLTKGLVERDQLTTRLNSLEANIERFNNQLENMDREIDDLLRGEEVDQICERFAVSEQMMLLNKINDNRGKLLKNGFPLNFFA